MPLLLVVSCCTVPGFTTKELDSFDRVFQRVDRDGSDTMSASEFANALTWLGFPYRAEKLQAWPDGPDRPDGAGVLVMAVLVCFFSGHED